MTSTHTPPVFVLPAALVSQGYTLRSETDADLPFLMRLYAATREEELKPVPWSEGQKLAFLASQFQAQRRHYRSHIAGCSFDVLERDGEPVGRLYLEPRKTRLHIVDIALMPDVRGQGLGTAILQGLQAAARAQGKGVGIMVETFNPALRLYHRLGFTQIADHDVYWEMQWMPDAARGGVS